MPPSANFFLKHLYFVSKVGKRRLLTYQKITYMVIDITGIDI